MKDKFPRHTSLTSLKSLETYKLNNFGMKWNEEMLSIYRLEASTIPPNPSTIPPNPNTIPPNPCKYVNGVHLANLTNLTTFHFFFKCLVAL